MARAERRDQTFWGELVAEYEAVGGLDRAAFCQGKGVNERSFCNWLYKLRKEQAAERPMQFVEIQSRTTTPMTSTLRATIECGGGLSLHLEGLPEPAWLAEFIVRTRGGERC